ncbi:MAG: hypothetical protein WAT39_03665 [Planctomycetota bacterium]
MNDRSAVFLLLAAAACDSGGSPPPPTAEVRPDVVITEDTMLAAASTAYRAACAPTRALRSAVLLLELPPLGWEEPGAPPIGQAEPTEPEPPLVNPEIQILDGPEGGTAIRTWDDRDGDDGYSTGDLFSVAFNDYGEGMAVLNGSVLFEGVTVAGDMIEGLTWMFAARCTLAVTLQVGDAVIPVSGSFRLDRQRRATVKTLELELTAPLRVGVTIVAAGGRLARNDYTLDFTMAVFADGEVLDPVLGGTLAFHVEEPMTGVQVLADPMAGLLEVQGASEAVLTVRAIDFFNAELFFDPDADEGGDESLPGVTTPIEYALLWNPPPEPLAEPMPAIAR